MKSSLINSIGEVVTDYGTRVMKVFKKGLLGRSLFDFYGDIKADALRTNESSTAPGTPADGKGGVIYTKAADGKLYYKSNEVSEVELSANGGTITTTDTPLEGEALVYSDSTVVWGHPEKIHLQVRNDEGSTIPAGAPLYSKIEIGGSGRLKVGICDANDPAKMPCIGLAEAEMNTTSTKDNFAITQGVYNTNISGFTGLAVGDTLYVDTSGSAPHLTKTKPTGESSLIQNVGIVLKTNGSICQGLQVSAIGRTNDVPNLDQNALFIGNASNQAVATDAPMVGVITAADAGAARTVLGVDAAGTDNSTNVTLAGAPDYITISGQEITRNAIDLTADVSGALPVANGGTGATSLASTSILTGNGTSAIVAQPKLTYSGEILSIGESDAGEAVVTRNNGAGTNGGDLSIRSGRATGGTNLTGGDLKLHAGHGTGNAASGDIIFEAGVPGSSGTGIQATQEIATLDSTGNLSIDGDLTVKGNDIKDDDGTTCITFDSSGNTTINGFTETNLKGSVYDSNNVAVVTTSTGGNSTFAGTASHAETATSSESLTTGDKTVDGNLTVNGNVAIGDDAEITSVGSMVFRIDSDANESSQTFTFRDNTSTDLAELDEGGIFTIYGGQLGQPGITLQQSVQTDTYGPPVFTFNRVDVNVDNADIGRVDFKADDSAGNLTTYAQILGLTEESGAGTEGGKIEFKIASHDAELVTGLKIEDGNAEDEVDVTIGSGTNSATTVVGRLYVDGSLNMTNVIRSSSGNDLKLETDQDMYFRIDVSGNSTNKFYWQHYAGGTAYTTMATFDETGVFQITNTTDDRPKLSLYQSSNTTSAASPQLEFYRSSLQSDNAELGEIVFKSLHQYGSETTYAKIIGIVEDTTFSERGGAVKIQVASHDGDIVDGLVVEDGDANDEVDVTIASGANSLTTVAGNLNVTGSVVGKMTQFYSVSFIDDLNTTEHFLPWKDINEQTTVFQEEAAMIMPYDGRIKSVTMRMSSTSYTAIRTLKILTFGPNSAQFTRSSWTEEETESISMNGTDDNHVFHFVFDNAKHFESGELVSIAIQDSADLHAGYRYCYVTVEVEFDMNNGLGTSTTSAEYDSAQ